MIRAITLVGTQHGANVELSNKNKKFSRQLFNYKCNSKQLQAFKKLQRPLKQLQRAETIQNKYKDHLNDYRKHSNHGQPNYCDFQTLAKVKS